MLTHIHIFAALPDLPPPAIQLGDAGTWFGPTFVIVLALALDYSAVGPTALRDRLAVAGYYAGGVSFVHLLGLASWLSTHIVEYNWRMIGACACLVVHGALVLAMFGGFFTWTKALAEVARAKTAFGASEKAKINNKLVGWAFAAAGLSPLAGNAIAASIINNIVIATIGLWSTIAVWFTDSVLGT